MTDRGHRGGHTWRAEQSSHCVGGSNGSATVSLAVPSWSFATVLVQHGSVGTERNVQSWGRSVRRSRPRPFRLFTSTPSNHTFSSLMDRSHQGRSTTELSSSSTATLSLLSGSCCKSALPYCWCDPRFYSNHVLNSSISCIRSRQSPASLSKHIIHDLTMAFTEQGPLLLAMHRSSLTRDRISERKFRLLTFARLHCQVCARLTPCLP
jgi:hypothetical protein